MIPRWPNSTKTNLVRARDAPCPARPRSWCAGRQTVAGRVPRVWCARMWHASVCVFGGGRASFVHARRARRLTPRPRAAEVLEGLELEDGMAEKVLAEIQKIRPQLGKEAERAQAQAQKAAKATPASTFSRTASGWWSSDGAEEDKPDIEAAGVLSASPCPVCHFISATARLHFCGSHCVGVIVYAHPTVLLLCSREREEEEKRKNQGKEECKVRFEENVQEDGQAEITRQAT